MLEAVYWAALRPGDVAVDIGAHLGRHALPMARRVGPTGKVVAFEPLPGAYSALKAGVEEAQRAEAGLASVVLHNLALGTEDGEAQFIYVPEFPEYSGFRERVYHTDSLHRETISVQVTRLDSFMAQLGTVRFMKIDAEGAELTILQGATAVISKSLPIVAFELGDAALVNYEHGAADYFDFFSALGYTVFSIFGIPLSRNELISAAQEQFFWDYVAVAGAGPWPFGHAHVRALIAQFKAAHQNDYDGVAALAEREQAALARARGAEARAAAAEAQVAALHSSTSWRATAPMRRISSYLKTLGR